MASRREQVFRLGELNPKILEEALDVNGIESFRAEQIFVGNVSECFRLHISYASSSRSSKQQQSPRESPPSTVIMKLPSSDPQVMEMASRWGQYQNETSFYSSLQTSVDVATPKCYYSAFNPTTGAFTLILEDMMDARPGNDARGGTLAEARLAVQQLARLHAPCLRGWNPTLEHPWLVPKPPLTGEEFKGLFSILKTRWAKGYTDEQLELCSKLSENWEAYFKHILNFSERGLSHMDYRLENMLFRDGESDGTIIALTVIDWQNLNYGFPLSDLAQFLGGSLRTEDRRLWHDELLATYIDELGEGTGITKDKCVQELRRLIFLSITVCILASVFLTRDERTQQRFGIMLQRQCQLGIDIQATQVLEQLD